MASGDSPFGNRPAAGSVDVHVHVYPDKYIDILERNGVDVAITRGKRATQSPDDIALRLRLMDEADVDVQVLSLAGRMPYLESPQDSLEAARIANDEIVRIAHAHPGRFAGFACLPLPHLDETLLELERIAGIREFVGVIVSTSIQGRALSHSSFAPLFEALEERAMTIFLHPSGCGIHSPLINDYGLEWLIGGNVEDQVALADLLKNAMPSTYPNVNFIVPHLGGGTSHSMRRFQRSALAGRTTWSVEPLEEARRVWYDTVGWSRPAFKAAAEVFGTDRLLLGSDFPYCTDEEYGEAVTYFESAVSREQLHDIRGNTARRILNLDSLLAERTPS